MEIKNPKYNEKNFSCPDCGVLSEQIWSNSITIHYSEKRPNGQVTQHNYNLQEFRISKCKNCEGIALWKGDKMVYPISRNAPLPNDEIPEEIKVDYEEARSILNESPRGASALLRLVIQKLCKHIGEKGKDINEDIGSLVKKNLPEKVQQALDIVRVVGNNAVHPGQIDLKDDTDTANKLFDLVNIIAEVLIAQPKHIKDVYNNIVPEAQRMAIEKRDKT